MNKKIFILATFVSLIKTVLSSDLGNISFYGRGQASLATHWCSAESINSSTGVQIYFPQEDKTQSAATNNKIRNYPLIIYMPSKGKKDYSYINFSLTNPSADLLESSSIKSELRISVPNVDDLIAEGYTCESIGLTCTDLKSYDFTKNEKEWLSKVDLRFYIESDDIRSDPQYDNDEIEYFRLRLSFGQLSTSWKEYVSKISFEEYYENLPYREFLIRNYGNMPVNIHIGNTLFLKSRVIPLITNGAPASGFSSISWLINGAGSESGVDLSDVCPDDPEKKMALVYSAINKADFGYYVHNSYSDTYGPPEAVSFRIRSYFVNNFKFKIDNIKEFNLTTEFSIPRNCKIPNEKEVNILVDVRSLIYADSYHMVNNDITGFFIQAYTDNDHVVSELEKKKKDKSYIEKNTSKVYFYNFNLHNTYPTNLKQYTLIKYDTSVNKECDISMRTHKDWKGKDFQWPTVIDSINKFYKLIVNTIDDSELKDESELPKIFKTEEECQANIKLLKRCIKSNLRNRYSCDKELVKLSVDKSYREDDIINQLAIGIAPQTSIISLVSVPKLNCSAFNYLNVENVPHLKKLQINNHDGLNCGLPEHLGKLNNLKEIDLKNNKLTGNIPEYLGDLENLEIINLSNNQLKGAIPTKINDLKKLKEFDVSYNEELEGEILETTLESCNYLNTTVCYLVKNGTDYCITGSDDECPEKAKTSFANMNYQISFTLYLIISFILCSIFNF